MIEVLFAVIIRLIIAAIVVVGGFWLVSLFTLPSTFATLLKALIVVVALYVVVRALLLLAPI